MAQQNAERAGRVAPEPAILVVDDRPENLTALLAVLEPLGARVSTATSGDEALRALLIDDFALILLDVQMPGMDGFAMAELIKQHPRTSLIPIIFLTAFDERLDLAVQGYSSGAVDYLAKPFDPWILRSKARVFLDLHRKSTELAEQTRRLEAHIDELHESRRELANAQRIAQTGSWDLDLASMTVRSSDQLRVILGVRPDEPLEYEHLKKYIGDDDNSSAREPHTTVAERTLVRPDGSQRQLIVTTEPVLDEFGIVTRLVGTVQDVTERRAAAEALASATRELERERELVDLLQQSVAPEEMPEIPGLEISSHYLPSGRGIVGGDWFDVLPLDDGAVLLVIGDVAGHGLASASAMAQIRTASRVVAMRHSDPRDILAEINRFAETAFRAVFLTMLVVRCDPTDGTCVMASAGHLPPVIGGGRQEAIYLHPGPPLGSGNERDFPNHEFRLEADEALVLYTDGLVERRRESLDIGIERLVDATAKVVTTEGGVAEALVRTMCPPGTTTDDVAVLVVKRRVP